MCTSISCRILFSLCFTAIMLKAQSVKALRLMLISPASSTSASEAANAHALKRRGPIFILVTNLPLSFGGPLAVSIFLIVLQCTGIHHLSTLWRVTFGIGLYFPIDSVLFSIEDAQLHTLSSRCYQAKTTIWVDSQVLLALTDWYCRSMVSSKVVLFVSKHH